MQNEPSLQDIEDMATGIGGYVDTPIQLAIPAKSKSTFILFGVFFGLCGVHNFYAGYTGRAVAQLLISIILGPLVVGVIIVGMWVFVELLTVRTDKRGRPLV